MAYTALFIEVLIVGVQACTWIAILFARFVMKPPLDVAALWAGSTTAGAVTLLVPWVYTVGILFDRLADYVFWKLIAPPILRRKHLSEKHYKEMCVLLIEKGGAASVDFYRYYLSRVRITRAAAINVPCLFFAAGLIHPFSLFLYIPFAIATSGLVVWSYLTLAERYFTRTVRIYDLLIQTGSPTSTST